MTRQGFPFHPDPPARAVVSLVPPTKSGAFFWLGLEKLGPFSDRWVPFLPWQWKCSRRPVASPWAIFSTRWLGSSSAIGRSYQLAPAGFPIKFTTINLLRGSGLYASDSMVTTSSCPLLARFAVSPWTSPKVREVAINGHRRRKLKA